MDAINIGHGMCSAEKGFVQCETGQDAPYYGIWANPTKLYLVTYCEGDCTIETAESKQEFCERMRSSKEWHVERFKTWHMYTEPYPEIHQAFLDLGLQDVIEDVEGD